MTKEEISAFIENIQNGTLTKDDAYAYLQHYPFADVGCAKIDTQRESRTGCAEVVFGESKTADEILVIVRSIVERGQYVLITRTCRDVYDLLNTELTGAGDVVSIHYNERGRTISVVPHSVTIPTTDSYIAIVSAGTADNAVVEEAYETARILGNRVEKITDVGVAGIHRLFAELDRIRGAKVIIAVAGMEGALPSVVTGLVDVPVIAVPTSVGYGANLGGISALLGMLNSCANGISVVNIDNGYGAAYNASLINHIGLTRK